MKSKKFSVMLCLIFCALLAQAQDTPPDSSWDSDPLDVLEQKKAEAAQPSVPEFKEVPAPGSESANPPPPEIAEPTPPVEAPAAPADVPPAPVTTELAPSVPPSATAGGNSEPDYSKEAEFHRIYKDYNQQPTAPETWEKVVGARSSEVYRIQKGDTLSGVSTTLFGDQFFWPKIWSLNNGQILNPHEINPGMNIQFFPGSAEEAPTLDLAKAETEAPEEKTIIVDVTPAEAPAVEGSDGAPAPVKKKTAKLTLPTPKKRTPLLKNLPGSLPQYKMGPTEAKALQMQIELPKNKFPTALEYLNYYIAESPVMGVGEVVGAEMNMKTAGEYQYVFVRLNETTEKNFVAQKNTVSVPDPADKKHVGQMVELQGEVEVLEKVNDQKNVYRAIVRKAIEPVEVGAVLTPGKLPLINPTVENLTSGVGAKIMGGQIDRKRHLFGANSIVFLDAGSSQGLQEGQSLPIYADERVRNKNTDAVQNDRVIGAVKIVRVNPSFATAYVVRATEDVLLGDYVGKMSSQARVEAPPPPAEKSDVIEETPASPTEDLDGELEKQLDNGAPASEEAPSSGSGDGDLEL